MIKEEYYELVNGIKIPKVGFGTWQSSKEDCLSSVGIALKQGYTHIDTAFAYQNEDSVAKALENSDLKREDVFITTKLPAQFKTKEEALKYFNTSLKNLNTDYIDLYLIHAPWPWSNVGQNCDAENIEIWKVFIDLYKQGKIKAIGVSNFSIENIKNLYNATKVMPMVNQIRYFIGNTQKELTEYCQSNNILIEAYSPLATGEILNSKELIEMSKKYNKTVAQICIRYCIEKGVLPLPKSIHENRIIENIDIDFSIDKDDLKYLDSLDLGTKKYLRS